MTKNILIRNVPGVTTKAIKELAEIDGMSQEAYLKRLLEDHVKDNKGKADRFNGELGFVKFDFPGLDGDEVCDQCGEPFQDQHDGSTYAALTYSGVKMVVCYLCAMDYQ